MASRLTALSRPGMWLPSGSYLWLFATLAYRLIAASWANAGVWADGVKGIPDTSSWTVLNVMDYGAYNDGTHVSETTAAIQAAVNAAGSNYAIYFPAGTYAFTHINCYLKSRMVLRGAGPTLTTLMCYGNGEFPAILIEGASALTGPYTISSGATRGSNSIVVSSVSGLSVGDIVTIFPRPPDGFLSLELNQQYYGSGALPITAGIARLPIESTYPPAGQPYEGWSYNTMTYPRTGAGSNCHWFEGFGQLVEITAIDTPNLRVYFKEPLYYDYSAYTPMLKKRGPTIDTSGIESMKIQFSPSATAGGHLVRFWYAKNCWIQKCELANTRLHGIYLRYNKSCEITNNYIHHAIGYAGSQAYLISIADYNADLLVYNNIVYHGRHHIVLEGGGQGCVIAYNYSQDTMGDTAGWMFSDLGLHGRHPYMNLWEGNYAGGLEFDNIHGSSSHNFVLRNAFSARGSDDYGPYTAAQIGMKIAKNSIYHSFVGNVLGYSGCVADGYTFEHYEAGYYRRYMQYIGATGDTAGPVSANPDSFEFPWSMPRNTGLFHGNYDFVGNAARWDPSISARDIPPSLYLTTKPVWFGDLTWPAIGPDIGGYLVDIPAKKRWDTYVISNNPADLFA